MVRTTPFHPWLSELTPESASAPTGRAASRCATPSASSPLFEHPRVIPDPAEPGSLVRRELMIDHRAARVPEHTTKLALFDCGQRVQRDLRPGQHPQ